MSAHVNITADITEIRADHVWTDSAGVTHGSLDLGLPWISFDDPQQVREIAQKLIALAAAMDAQAAWHAAGVPCPARTE
ncbi:MAG TPA: hypothetical protein VGI66_10260 [Streptosporangiaceae bacterium]|jgi:hypothetical protein